MKILCIGDVVGSIGCAFLRKRLPALKKIKGIDLVICNGENSADGNGITPVSAQHLFTSGVNVITLGNHSFRRKEAYDMIDNEPCLIRPANYPPVSAPGKGITHVDMGKNIVTVINLMGNSHMEQTLRCPFETMDQLLQKEEGKIIIVDFHGETTSEKRALGFHLDGRVSAVFGTHTHVQTADAQVLPKGTGYITDVGMTGTIQSVLGVKPEIIIEKFRSGMPARFDLAQGECKMDCVIFNIDEKTGKCLSAENLSVCG